MSNPEQLPNHGLSAAQKDQQNIMALLKAKIQTCFDNFNNSSDRVDDIFQTLGEMIEYQNNKDELTDKLNELRSIEDKEIFCSSAFDILKQLIQWRQENLAEFENIRRKSFNEQGHFIEINQMLSYDINGKYIYIHVPPNMSTPTPDKLRLIQEGLKALVPIMEAHPEIEGITGTSWIVATHPDILEKKFHFTIKGPINEEERALHFSHDHRPIARATMSREDLIKYYS